MQATRERILNILKERDEATVKELSEDLDLTTVTIRHHLDTLRREGLVAAPDVRHRKAPGRPQHIYTLTEKASDFFPKKYEQLVDLLLEEIREHLSREELDRMMQRIGERIAARVPITDKADLGERVRVTTEFLSEQGYMARWEQGEDGHYLIHIANCPYEGVSRGHNEVCMVDLTMLRILLGPSLERMGWAAEEDNWCTYVVPGGDG